MRIRRPHQIAVTFWLAGVCLLTAEEAPSEADKAPWEPGPKDGKLRIICFGAHPDDVEFRAGGVAAMWAALGHHVKFVSTTNGDAGHWNLGGATLARKRYDEVRRAAKVLGRL